MKYSLSQINNNMNFQEYIRRISESKNKAEKILSEDSFENGILEFIEESRKLIEEL